MIRNVLCLCALQLTVVAAKADENLTEAVRGLLKLTTPTPSWSEVIDARIAAGEPFPEMPEYPQPPDESEAPNVLLSHWRTSWAKRTEITPSPMAQKKILAAALDEPSAISEVLPALPQSAEAAELVAKKMEFLPTGSHEAEEKRREARAWVFKHCGMFREQVLADVNLADWKLYRWNEKPDPTLDALLAREPKTAVSILEDLANGQDLGLAVVAARLLLEKGNQVAVYRGKLMEFASDPKGNEDARGIAIQSLLSTEWKDRDDWVIDCLKSPTFQSTNEFAQMVRDAADHWIPILTSMVKGSPGCARNNAANLLGQFHLDDARKDALKPLLPWLLNPKWAEDEEMVRLRLIQSVANLGLDEASDGLRSVILTDEDDAYVAYAAESLSELEEERAIPDLKKALNRIQDRSYRRKVVMELSRVNGFGDDEVVHALEFYFLNTTPNQRARFLWIGESGGNPLLSVGDHFMRNPPSDEAILKAIAQSLKKIEQQHPDVAKEFRDLLVRSNSNVGRKFILDLLHQEKITIRQLAIALEQCRENEGWDGSLFTPSSKQAGAVGGFAATLARDAKRQAEILDGTDKAAQAAVLASARLVGDVLDTKQVLDFSEGNDELLASAATAYLLSREEPEVRDLVAARGVGKDEITGGRSRNDPGHFSFRDFDRLESQLSARFSSHEPPQEVFALLSAGYWGNSGQWYLVVYPSQTLAIRDYGMGRIGACKVSTEQLQSVRDYVAKYRVDDLPPLNLRVDDGIQFEYVHATPDWARRVFMNNPPTNREAIENWLEYGTSTGIVVYSQLVNTFTGLFDELDLEVSYGSDIDVIIPRELAQIRSAWKDGDDLRVLVENSRDALHWQGVDLQNAKLTGPVDEPKECTILEAKTYLHPNFEAGFDQNFRLPWQVAVGDGIVHNGEFGDVRGLWLCRRNAKPELIAAGSFSEEIVSTDGKWCVVAMMLDESWANPNTVVRINLQTKEVFPVDLEPADNFNPVAYSPVHEKFLIYRQRDREVPGVSPNAGPEKTEYHLLDAATGALEQVSGRMALMDGRPFRKSQNAGSEDMSWKIDHAAGAEKGTVIGRFNEREFTFDPVKTVLGVYFEESAMWVDENENRIYAAVNGDLIRIQLDL